MSQIKETILLDIIEKDSYNLLEINGISVLIRKEDGYVKLEING